MEMKINLNQIFGTSHPDHHEQVSDISNFHRSVVSQPVSVQTSFNPCYKLNRSLFENNQDQIMVDRNQQDSNFDDSRYGPSPVANSEMKNNGSMMEQMLPGQRLYYESKNNILKRNQQIERIKMERIAKQEHENTFKPTINKRSERIANRVKNLNEEKRSTKTNLKKQQQEPSKIIKQKKQTAECTFKPQLITQSNLTATRKKQQIFDKLYKTSKIREMKQKLKTQEQSQKTKKRKITTKEFEDFIDRNNQYLNRNRKKTELIIKASTEYDLDTGQKLFTPKIIQSPIGRFRQDLKSSRNNSNQQQSVGESFDSSKQIQSNPPHPPEEQISMKNSIHKSIYDASIPEQQGQEDDNRDYPILFYRDNPTTQLETQDHLQF